MKTDTLDLRNMDCMELMKEFPDNYFDLAVVDPPYGIGQNGARNKTRTRRAAATDYKPVAGGDKKPPNEQYFIELFRVSKNQIIWGANHFISKFAADSPSWIVWDKHNSDNGFADCELAFTSHKKAVRKFDFMWSGMMQGCPEDGRVQQGNKKLNEKRIHPTQKPVALYNWIFKNYAKPGMKILDTHMGSGSIAIASHYAGMHLTASELDEHYFPTACERIENETSQLCLFEQADLVEEQIQQTFF